MYDVVVVGGGIIGMLSALELKQAGLSVALIDKGALGQESSWAGGGILSPLYPWRYSKAINRLAAWSQHRYARLAEQIHLGSGIDAEIQMCGLLLPNLEDVPAAQVWAREYPMDYTMLTPQQLLSVEPGLGGEWDSAMFFPGIGHVRNPRLVRGLGSYLDHMGVEIFPYTAVEQIQCHNNRVEGVCYSNGMLKAGLVLVASGAWSQQVLQDFKIQTQVQPVKGQMLVFSAEQDVLQHMVLFENRYLIPRRDGRVLAGSTIEYTGFDKSTTPQGRKELEQFALQMVPALSQFPIEKHWAGLRPGSPNSCPMITPHPDVGGLYINAGHFRNGLVLAPASAHLVVDLMLDRKPILDPADYRLQD